MEKDVNNIAIILAKTIDFIKLAEIEKNRNYITITLSNKKRTINLTYNAFKASLKQLYTIEGKELKEYLRNLRDLNFIITDQETFTKVQRINGKPKRVISINENTYLAIRRIMVNSYSIK